MAESEGTIKDQSRAGFVAILGAPNVGKSTLVNQLVGAKVSIVSPKVQTTRSRVLGIYIRDQTQVVLIDTPGIFEPKRRLDRAMVAAAWSGAEDADTFALLVDATSGVDNKTQAIVDKISERGKRGILVLNKIDQVGKETLLPIAEELMNSDVFDELFMVSAKTGDGVDDLSQRFAEGMRPGPWLFPEDEISDLPARLLAAEITREKLFLNLHQELPYRIAVETDGWLTNRDGSARVDQVIYVDRDSQKGIVLGKRGEMVKRIGTQAREELADLLDTKIHLFVRVKVRRNWEEDPERYREWGLDFNA